MNRIAKELGIGMGHCIDISKIKAIYATTSYKETLNLIIDFKQIKDDYHSNYEVMQVSLDDPFYNLKSIIRHYCNVFEAGNNKLRFYQSAFYQELFDFYYDLFKSDDDTYTKFKTNMLLQSLSTSVFAFQIEHRHISIEAYRNYLLNIYLDEVVM